MRALVRSLACALVLTALAPRAGRAQADEIQVYDGGLAPVGVFNLTWHNNFTPDGVKVPAFPGGVISNHAFVGVAEWALGVTDFFEAGLYAPLYSYDDNNGFAINGAKLRTLFAVPHADDRKFFYGANFEFSYNAKTWDTQRITSEIRPIIGWHLGTVDVVLNPIVDTNYKGGIGNLELVPATRLAKNLSNGWAVAVEEYAGLGTINDVQSFKNQSHQLYAVFDKSGPLEIELGAGVGLTDSADKFTLKMILAKDLNVP
jgi:hypothetical protein